jgi:murein DD-endopeptidase MepM/ murein hydrolase activator NlpD
VIRWAAAGTAVLVLASTGCSSGDPVVAPDSAVVVTTLATTSTTVVKTTTTAAPTTTPTTATTARPNATRGRYVFPVAPAARASYGRSHAGYPATDIFIACGSSFLATTTGRVDEVSRVDQWDPARDDPALRSGLFVSIVGDDGVRYYGSHLREVAAGIDLGRRVAAGELLGLVGTTGNARNTPCHVHYGISPPTAPGDWETRRGVVYPWPYLDSWKAGGEKAPADEVQQWAASH